MKSIAVNEEQLQKIKTSPGFVAALDQSGGSTPKALRLYGIQENTWSSDEEMFTIVHQMRTRIITSPVFNGERIIGAILFENTMEREIEGQPTADRSEEHTSELQSHSDLVCRLLLEKKKKTKNNNYQTI